LFGGLALLTCGSKRTSQPEDTFPCDSSSQAFALSFLPTEFFLGSKKLCSRSYWRTDWYDFGEYQMKGRLS